MPESVYHYGIYNAEPGLVPWAYVAPDPGPDTFSPTLRIGLTAAELAVIKARCGNDHARWKEIYRELAGILEQQHIRPPRGRLVLELPGDQPGPRLLLGDSVLDVPWPAPVSLDAARVAITRAADQGQGDDPESVIGSPRNHPGGDAMWIGQLRHGLGAALAGDVLDLGCGPGRVTRLVAPLARSVTGLDVSPYVVAAAQDPARWAVEGNVRYVVGNGVDLPFPNAAFDAVYSMFVFQHITPLAIRERYLHEIARVLRPGGKALIETKVLGVGLSWWMDHVEDWSADVSWCSTDEAVPVLESYGFHVEKAWTTYGNQEPGALWLWTTLSVPAVKPSIGGGAVPR